MLRDVFGRLPPLALGAAARVDRRWAAAAARDLLWWNAYRQVGALEPTIVISSTVRLSTEELTPAEFCDKATLGTVRAAKATELNNL